MSSLQISGWTLEDCSDELKDILAIFGDMTIEKMSKLNPQDVSSALEAASLIYLSGDDAIKMDAFNTCEKLEYIQQNGFSYARNAIREALEEQADEDLEWAVDAIMRFYNELFDRKGFQSCRLLNQTFNNKSGNYTGFVDLKLECYDDVEMVRALVLANEIIRSPFDYLDVCESAIQYGHFSSISEYLEFLAEENFQEWMKAQLAKGKMFIDYKEPLEFREEIA